MIGRSLESPFEPAQFSIISELDQLFGEKRRQACLYYHRSFYSVNNSRPCFQSREFILKYFLVKRIIWFEFGNNWNLDCHVCLRQGLFKGKFAYILPGSWKNHHAFPCFRRKFLCAFMHYPIQNSPKNNFQIAVCAKGRFGNLHEKKWFCYGNKIRDNK